MATSYTILRDRTFERDFGALELLRGGRNEPARPACPPPDASRVARRGGDQPLARGADRQRTRTDQSRRAFAGDLRRREAPRTDDRFGAVRPGPRHTRTPRVRPAARGRAGGTARGGGPSFVLENKASFDSAWRALRNRAAAGGRPREALAVAAPVGEDLTGDAEERRDAIDAAIRLGLPDAVAKRLREGVRVPQERMTRLTFAQTAWWEPAPHGGPPSSRVARTVQKIAETKSRTISIRSGTFHRHYRPLRSDSVISVSRRRWQSSLRTRSLRLHTRFRWPVPIDHDFVFQCAPDPVGVANPSVFDLGEQSEQIATQLATIVIRDPGRISGPRLLLGPVLPLSPGFSRTVSGRRTLRTMALRACDPTSPGSSSKIRA